MSVLGATGTSGSLDVGPVLDSAGCWTTAVVTGLGPSTVHHHSAPRTRSRELVLASAWLALITGDSADGSRWQTLAAAREGMSWELTLGESDHRGALAVMHVWRGVGEISELCELGSAAYDALPADSPWRPLAGLLSGLTLTLTGRERQGHNRLRVSEELAQALDQPGVRADCLAALAGLAFGDGDQRESQHLIMRARTLLLEHNLLEQPSSEFAVSAVALGLARAGRSTEAGKLIRIAQGRTEPTVASAPWLQIQSRILQINACLLIGDVAAARLLTRQARDMLRRSSTERAVFACQQTSVTRAEIRLAKLPADANYAAQPSTLAELRILHLRPTHLTFPEMGALLFVTRHTVKTQALGIYRKLGANSRNGAVQRACDLGYLPSMLVPDSLSGSNTVLMSIPSRADI